MKYIKTKTYTSKRSYSSHPNLSEDEIRGIQNANYNEIPDDLQTPWGKIQLYDNWGDFLPYIPSDDWKIARGWAIHIQTGVKVKLETSATPSYYAHQGCGEMTTTLSVKIPHA